MKHRLTVVVAAIVLAVAGFTGPIRASHSALVNSASVAPSCAGDCTWLGK
jgi:hypothetical protein